MRFSDKITCLAIIVCNHVCSYLSQNFPSFFQKGNFVIASQYFRKFLFGNLRAMLKIEKRDAFLNSTTKGENHSPCAIVLLALIFDSPFWFAPIAKTERIENNDET